jgi:hypothetical protein
MIAKLKTAWAKVRAWFRNSFTIFVADVVAGIGGFFEAVNQYADLANDAALKAQLAELLPADKMGRLMFAVGLIVRIARMRTAKKA